jgi:hypothetical protein
MSGRFGGPHRSILRWRPMAAKGRSCHSTPRSDSNKCCAMHISTRWVDCRHSLQARAIHPAGVEANIQATPKLGLALRCRKSALSPLSEFSFLAVCVGSKKFRRYVIFGAAVRRCSGKNRTFILSAKRIGMQLHMPRTFCI